MKTENKNAVSSMENIEVKSAAFEALKRAAEADENAIFPLAVSIAFSNLKTALDPQRKTAVNFEAVSNSGMDKKLNRAKAELAIAVNQINSLNTTAKEANVKKKIVKSFDKSTGKMVISVKADESGKLEASPEEIDRINSCILGETLDGIGLELVQEISLSLLESREQYGKRGGKWLEKDVIVRKPKKTVLASRDEKPVFVEEVVKPIQIAYRAGANFINRQRAVKDRIADTVYLDMFTDSGESELPKELSYSMEDCVLKVSSTYSSLAEVEEIESLISKMNLTKREARLLNWILDGMDCYAFDSESGKKEKIHIDNPTNEFIAIRLNVTDRTVKRDKVRLQEKAERIGLSPARLAQVKKAAKIRQISPDTGKTIAIYSSRAEAAKATGIDKSNILKALSGKWNFAGGYIWKYCENQLVNIEENSARKHF